MQGGGAGWACTHCREPLGGSAFRALGRGYHLRCFACAACKTPLPDGRFFASKPIPPATDQIPLCDQCYGNMYLQKCAACGDYITGKEAVVACGKRFHPEHFVCALCKCPLGAKFYPHEGMPYCRQDIDVVTGRVAGAGLRPAAPLPPDPQQPPFSPPSVAPASSPVVAPQALAASPMARHEGNGGTSSSTGDLVAAARRLMPPPSSRAQIPAASTGPDADATPKPTSESSRPRSPRQQLPSAHAPSSRSSSNLALPPRPLKSTATPLSRSQPESPRSQQVSSSPVASRFRAQSEAGSPPAVAASPAAAQSRVTSPPQRLASSPVVPRKSFDEPASSRPSLFDLGLVTPRSPGAPGRIRVRPEDGRILPQRNRRASLDKALERSDSKTCLECLQQFAELSPSEYGKGQCPRCEIQRKRSSSTAVQAPIVLESADDYDLWIEQDKLAKLQWPKNAVEEEGLVRECGYPRELGSREAGLQDVEYRHIERAAPYYKQFLHAQEHENYLVGLEESKEPGILSVETTSSKRVGKQFVYRALLRTARGDERFLVQGSKNGKKKPKVSHIRRSHDALKRENVPLVQVSDKAIANDLAHFEDRMRNKRFKIGVLYARPGQTTEDEIYGNETGSKAFDDFLLLLGEKVELKSHTKFAGGLQTKEGAATGRHSIYTEFQGLEIMFHVATYIPFTPEDRQQVERKRHIGNDIVVIVFRDGTDGIDGFSAANISSHFNHTFVVVEPVQGSSPLAYKVGLVYKSGVRPSKPFLPFPPTFQANDTFRQWMLTKLINAEISSLHSPEFLSVLRRTRRELLREIVGRYDAKLLKVAV